MTPKFIEDQVHITVETLCQILHEGLGKNLFHAREKGAQSHSL